jgi:acetylornithine deacetylase/succinyl-diaminopimelate desuccinylase-like protein
MDTQQLQQDVTQVWEESILPTLIEFIKIPNKSPLFEPNWETLGHMEKAVQLITNWCEQRPIKGLSLQVHRLPQRTPVILIDIAGHDDRTVLLYGHLDKQPEMEGWQPDLAPWTPVRKGDHLFGRGGADDGYAVFASLTAIEALQRQNIPHSRCVILIEACEESGSYDLPYHIDALQKQIGTPELVICLDSGCGNYEQLWCTTSLRGLVGGNLTIQIMTEGIHSGYGSGIIVETFRILRQLLDRLDDQLTGNVLLPELNTQIPQHRVEQAQAAAAILKETVFTALPVLPGVQPVNNDPTELLLNRTWRPALSITGIGHMPHLDNAGNVLRPQTTVKLSMRIPPTCNADDAIQAIKQTLEKNPPYGAKVEFIPEQGGTGWNAPETAPWLLQANQEASHHFYGKDAMYMGEGGSIPFMGMLGEKFPHAQFLIAGVLGPHSNAHGPNEFLHIPMAKKLTCCVSYVLAQHFVNASSS